MIDIVFCGKNDLHGGISFEEKVILMLERNTRIFRKYDLQHTFWFVEWGEEPEKGWLSPKLVKRFANCRCIMVPDSIVAKAQNPPVRFQEFTAKNIGISRGTGSLVIATNSDIIFSEALVKELRTLTPDDNSFYRTARYDISCEMLPENEDEFRITTKYEPGRFYCEAAGDFLAATPRGWEMIQGYCESPDHLRHLDSEAVIKALSLGFSPVILPHVYHKEHPESTKFASEWRPEWGIHDSGLQFSTKIMPRTPFWGHMHCRLKIPTERLYLLQMCNWEQCPLSHNSPQQELFEDLFRQLADDAIILIAGTGNTNMNLAMGNACLGTRREVFSIDTSVDQTAAFANSEKKSLVPHELHGHVISIQAGKTELFSQLEKLSENIRIDFLLIESDLSFEEIIRVFNVLFPFVNEGGWVAVQGDATISASSQKAWEDIIQHGLTNHGNHGSFTYGQKSGPLPRWLDIYIKKQVTS